MTPDHEIERVLDRWFSEGPTEMPDRFLLDTLDRIDRAPERRLAGLRTRLPATHPGLRFAAAAAVVLAVASLGAGLVIRYGGVGSTPAGGGLPDALQGEWSPVGSHPLPVLSGTHQDGLDIVIGEATMVIQDRVDVLNSGSLIGPERLELRMLNEGTDWNCQVGDVGTFAFSLSPEGQLLTLTPVSDACATRASVLAGDWSRVDLGDLRPGRHDATLFRPFAHGTTGRLAYTVPAGWGRSGTADTAFTLARPSVSDPAAIRLLSNAFPSAQEDCSVNRSADGVGGSPAAFAAWLKALPGLVVSAPSAVTVGGLSGVMVDLSVVPDWMATCDPGIYTFSISGSDHGGWSDRLRLNGSDRARYILLDRGDGSTLVIAVEAPGAEWDAFVADAMPIIESFEFTR